MFRAADGDGAAIGGAPVNPGRAYRVRRKFGVFRIREKKDVGVVRIAAVVIEDAANPTRAGRCQVVPDQVVVVRVDSN